MFMAPEADILSSKLILFIDVFGETSLLIVLNFLKGLGKSVGLKCE